MSKIAVFWHVGICGASYNTTLCMQQSLSLLPAASIRSKTTSAVHKCSQLKNIPVFLKGFLECWVRTFT